VLSAERHFITPAVLSDCKVIKRMDGNGWYTLGYVLFSSVKNSQILSYSFFRKLWVWNNSGMVKLSYPFIHRRFSTWINMLWNQVTKTRSVSRTLHFVQCMGLIGMSIRAEKKKRLIIVEGYESLLCLTLYSIPLYSMCPLKTVTKPW